MLVLVLACVINLGLKWCAGLNVQFIVDMKNPNNAPTFIQFQCCIDKEMVQAL